MAMGDDSSVCQVVLNQTAVDPSKPVRTLAGVDFPGSFPPPSA